MKEIASNHFKKEELKEAKEADQDEEFIEGYENFLATEFDAQS